MLRRAVTASFLFVFLAALSFAQDKPNFSGTWKLNTAKSDFGVLPGPDSLTSVIEHADPTLKMTVNSAGQQGNQDYTVNYTTDGKEAVNHVGPREVKSTAVWDGSNMVVNSKLNFNDQDVTIKSVWTLSADGKTLTQNVHLASQMGETDQKLVLEKQEGSAPAAPTVAKTTPPPPAATSGAKPNFSGTWKLNTAKSEFGPIPGPDSQTDIIEHAEPAMKVSVNQAGQQGNMNFVLNMTTDGKEAVNQLAGNEVKSTSTWDGNNLLVNGKLKFQDQDITMKSVWTLSADGKTLTQTNHYTSGMGDADQTLVFENQGAAPAPATPAVATTAPAGARPNFSGVWKLNSAKSDFGVMPGPDVRTDTIEHNEPALKISRNENGPDGARQYALSMTTDGKETVNNLGGPEAKITASWEGGTLVVNTKLKLQDQDIAIHQVSTLSADGKLLTTKAHLTMSMGEMDQTEVYEKQ
jgi:hypothetical protein